MIEGLTQWVGLGTNSVFEVGSSGASDALSSLPLGTEKVSGWSVIGVIGKSEALAEVKSIASVARSTGSVGAVESLALGIRLDAKSSSEVGCLGASYTLGVSPLSAKEISWGAAVGLVGESEALAEVQTISSIA